MQIYLVVEGWLHPIYVLKSSDFGIFTGESKSNYIHEYHHRLYAYSCKLVLFEEYFKYVIQYYVNNI